MILYNWKCPNGHAFEALSDMSNRYMLCRECTENAKRMVSAPRPVLEGTSGSFPDASTKWEKRHTPKSRGGTGPEINTFGMGTPR